MYKTTLLLMLVLSSAAISPVVRADDAKTPYPAMAPIAQYMMASQTDEIALARTAAPAPISDKAEILVLGAHGYETAVQGSNGFMCYVGRSWENDFDNAEFWNPKIRTPQCWNAAAVSSVFPDIRNRAQWALAGVSKDEMAQRTKAAWASHKIGPPAPQSVAYMMSKTQYINDQATNWHPHIMFFVSPTEDSTWGANLAGSPVYSTTSDAEPVTTFFVIAPKWSDGSLAPYTPTPAAATGKPETHHH